MRKDLKVTRRLGLALAGIAFCTFLSCGYSSKISAKESVSSNNENFKIAYDTSNFDGNVESSYEVVYSEKLEIGEEKIALEILLNPKAATDGAIKIGNQEISINSELAKTVGYAHVEAKVYDFTGDEKEEIVLILSGGASGAVQAVQVFSNTDGKWDEINIPSEIYNDVPKFLKKELKKLDIKMDNSIVYYRTFSFKKEKILIDYRLFADSGTTAIGTIRKELMYSSNKKRFVLGDTLIIPEANRCFVTATTSKKAIIIKWISGVKRSSIQGIQIKVAAKKNMKDATTYKLNKKEAQKMSYKFTVKSGKIVQNQTYYFKVRLKTGNKWTKWSNIKMSKTVK